jgi:hypothetical protein
MDARVKPAHDGLGYYIKHVCDRLKARSAVIAGVKRSSHPACDRHGPRSLYRKSFKKGLGLVHVHRH